MACVEFPASFIEKARARILCTLSCWKRGEGAGSGWMRIGTAGCEWRRRGKLNLGGGWMWLGRMGGGCGGWQQGDLTNAHEFYGVQKKCMRMHVNWFPTHSHESNGKSHAFSRMREMRENAWGCMGIGTLGRENAWGLNQKCMRMREKRRKNA